jgi:hypothetical protein
MASFFGFAFAIAGCGEGSPSFKSRGSYGRPETGQSPVLQGKPFMASMADQQAPDKGDGLREK